MCFSADRLTDSDASHARNARAGETSDAPRGRCGSSLGLCEEDDACAQRMKMKCMVSGAVLVLVRGGIA